MQARRRAKRFTTRRTPQKQQKTPYHSWRTPFSGVDKENDLMFKLNYLQKGLRVYFGVKF
jgi:hypothetical protein